MRAVLLVLVLTPAVARADAARCQKGADLAAKNDLPRAALYLEGCEDDPAFAKIAAGVSRKLRASELSALSISTDPPGLTAETDALPGEALTTPATVWAKAGTYTVRVGNLQQTVKLEPHSRGTVVITAAAPKPPDAKDHAVDFGEEASVDAPSSGAPPDQKHPSILPCKFAGTCPAAGGALEDPLADRPRAPSDAAAAPLRLGVRVGGAMTHVGSVALSLGAAGALRLSERLALTARADWTRREASMQGLDALALAAGVATPVVTTDSALVTAGAAARGELRLGDMFDGRRVDRAGLAADATLDLVLRHMPIVIGARFEQGITPLVASTRNSALWLELALELR